KERLTKDLEETHGSKSPEVLSATELKVQLAQKEQELARAKEALQEKHNYLKRICQKIVVSKLRSCSEVIGASVEDRAEKERVWLESPFSDSTSSVQGAMRFGCLLAQGRVGLVQGLTAGSPAPGDVPMVFPHHHRLGVLPQAKQSLATLTKDVPKRHSLAMPGETVLNGNQEWVMQADLPLTAAIRQSQQTLYHSHPQHSADRQAVRVSPCHSRQPSIISDASAAEGDRSSTPSDINSPRHRTHSLCNGDSPGPVQKNLHNPIVQSLEDLEDQKRKKKKEKMGFGSISRVFARGKQRKSLDPGLFD
ncbi:Kazrin, partial [Opisthocomus hoazin]